MWLGRVVRETAAARAARAAEMRAGTGSHQAPPASVASLNAARAKHAGGISWEGVAHLGCQRQVACRDREQGARYVEHERREVPGACSTHKKAVADAPGTALRGHFKGSAHLQSGGAARPAHAGSGTHLSPPEGTATICAWCARPATRSACRSLKSWAARYTSRSSTICRAPRSGVRGTRSDAWLLGHRQARGDGRCHLTGQRACTREAHAARCAQRSRPARSPAWAGCPRPCTAGTRCRAAAGRAAARRRAPLPRPGLGLRAGGEGAGWEAILSRGLRVCVRRPGACDSLQAA